MATAAPLTNLPTQGLAWGIYDPDHTFSGRGDLVVEQAYVPWNRPAQITAALDAIRADGRVPIVALEPWPYVWAGMAEDTLLEDLVAGKYDASIQQACSALGRESPQPVLVRWGHEMDLVGRFPWSTSDAPRFVAAYRHFVTTCRATGATNILYVWSPGGAPTLQDYWPGAEFVDFVGLTGLGFAEWDVLRGAAQPATFREMFDPRYALVAGYDKPIVLCEFATTGPDEYRRRWIEAAGAAFASYPLLKGVIYFDAVDPVAWGDAGIPDWRVPAGSFPPAAATASG